MVRVDYQREVNELDEKRDDLMFEFVHSKFKYFHQKLMNSFSYAAEIYDYKIKSKKQD